MRASRFDFVVEARQIAVHLLSTRCNPGTQP